MHFGVLVLFLLLLLLLLFKRGKRMRWVMGIGDFMFQRVDTGIRLPWFYFYIFTSQLCDLGPQVPHLKWE